MLNQNAQLQATEAQEVDTRTIGTQPWSHHKGFKNISSVGKDIKSSIEMAGLDFEVRKEQLFLGDGRPVKTYAIVRNDNNKILCDNIGPEWTAASNTSKFNWFQRYLDNGEATLDYAGQLAYGKKINILAKVNVQHEEEIVHDDPIQKYLLLTDSFGGHSLGFALLVCRGICANGMIFGRKDLFSMRVRHSSLVNQKLDTVHSSVDLWKQGFQETMEDYRILSRSNVKSDSRLKRYFMDVMDFEVKPGETELSTRSKNTMDTLMELFNDSTHNKGQSYWTALNAITAYQNHYSGRTIDSAIESLFYGSGNIRQHRALNVALEHSSKI